MANAITQFVLSLDCNNSRRRLSIYLLQILFITHWLAVNEIRIENRHVLYFGLMAENYDMSLRHYLCIFMRLLQSSKNWWKFLPKVRMDRVHSMIDSALNILLVSAHKCTVSVHSMQTRFTKKTILLVFAKFVSAPHSLDKLKSQKKR